MSNTRAQMHRFAIALSASLLLGSPALTDAGELVFDWRTQHYPAPAAGVRPVRWVAYQTTADPWSNPLLISHSNDAPVAILIRNVASPLDGRPSHPEEDRNTLATLLDWLDANDVQLDYVFTSFEFRDSTAPTDEQRRQENMLQNNANLRAVIDMVRSHPSADVNSARIGSFNYFGGTQMLSQNDPRSVDHTPVDTFYRTEMYGNDRALRIAMPEVYPFAYFKPHWIDDPWNEWDAYSTPNIRSALFWAPLENVSMAKRNLQPGDLLLPWFSTFVPISGYPVDAADQPTVADYRALVQHSRLRGADGYYTWRDALSPLDVAQTKRHWNDLNWFFARPGKNTVLNTDTNKTTALEWSGIRRGDRTLVLASNLSGTSASVPFTPATGLPAQSPTLANDAHLLLQYLVTPSLDESFESYPPYVTVDTFNFGGDGQDWEVRPGPAGSINATHALARKNADGYKTTWFELAKPAFEVTDRVVYSAKMFSGEHTAGTAAGSGFGLCFIDQPLRDNPANVPHADRQGVFIEFTGGANTLRVQLNMSDAQIEFVSSNTSLIAANSWYEVQLVVTDQANGGLGRIYVRDLSQNTAFEPVELDDTTQSGTPPVTEIPLFFADPYRKPTQFNGWEVWGHNSTVHFDDFKALLYPEVEQVSGPAQ